MSVLKIASTSFDNRWFVVVMATIMIITSSQLYGCEEVVPYFFTASLTIFFCVVVFKAAQIALFCKQAFNELLNSENTLHSFTVVGAVNLTGVCFSRILHLPQAAQICWYIAISLWLGISLVSFTSLFLLQKQEDRKIEDVVHGGWLYAVVGAQSTAYLGVIVAEEAMRHAVFIQFLSFALWSVGALLYLIFMVFIIIKMIFYKHDSEKASSSYWVNVGAAALTALAGAAWYKQVQGTGGPFTDFLPFSKGISLFYWSIGLWWMPFLVIFAVRKQLYYHKEPVFTVGYWEATLALGVYAEGTLQLAGLFEERALVILSGCFFLAGVVLWCFSAIFTVVHLARSWVWIPVNDLAIYYVVPYSFNLHGRLFHVKEVVTEWMDQSVQGTLQKNYCVVINNNHTCIITYNILTKEWHLNRTENLAM